MKTAALILAAGASTRFGSPKQLARIGDRTMLEVVIESARDAGLAPIIVVGPSTIAVGRAVTAVANDTPDSGMSASLKLGVGALPADVGRVVVLLGDQPSVGPGLIAEMVAAECGGRPFLASQAAGHLAPPVVMARDAFQMVEELRGDEGLRRVLEARAELVAPFPVASHAVDIDTPEELELFIEPCPGCGALLTPLPDGPSHAYIGASAACWSTFSELVAREFGDLAYGAAHRHSVDAYAAQHPGVDGPRARQSVAIHLICIALWLEHGVGPDALLPITRRLTERGGWPWLTPPTTYALTVHDVLRATSGEDHVRRVNVWATAVWGAWREHHAVIRGWAEQARGSD
ncbi:MAG: DUF5946 family protein [Candidatus Limnocylindria bacterium]